MSRDQDLLLDIIAAADDIQAFCASVDLESFRRNKTTRYAILHAVTIIGEAANQVSDSVQKENPHIPWRRIIAFRHRVVHGYGELDLELAWQVASVLVPQLRGEIVGLQEALQAGCDDLSPSPTPAI